MEIIIHGGMHKTASSALQYILSKNKSVLEELGYYYPEDISSHHGHLLNVQRTDWSPIGISTEITRATNLKMHTVIFSGETVSTFRLESYRTLQECFQGLDVLYVFNFRHWCEYWPSRWAQDCRRRDSHSFADYLSALRDAFNQHLDARFDMVLSRASHGTRARVIAVSYSNAARAGLSPTAAVFTAMGLPEKLVSKLSQSEQVVNPRSDWTSIEVLRILNGLVANRLGAEYAPLFAYRISGKFDDITFDLSRCMQKMPAEILNRIRNLVRENAQSVSLSCNDGVVTHCNHILNEEYGKFFKNKIKGSVFFGEFETCTTCTDLRWRDVAWPELTEYIDQFIGSSESMQHIRR